jgi:cold shock CspA family protein
LTKGGESADFSALEKGQKVEVEVEKVGKRLDPISVKIME